MKIRSAVAAIAVIIAVLCTGFVVSYASDEAPSDPHEHIYGEWENTETGHIRSCTVGECEESEEHLFGEWEDAELGHKRSCTVDGCDHTQQIGHAFGEWTKTAQTHSRTCTVSDCEENEQADHAFGEWTDVPLEGYRYKECSVCLYRITHTHMLGDYTPDLQNENRHYRICSCGDVRTKNSGDCTFDNGTPITNGTKYTCTYCHREKIHEHVYGSYIPDDVSDGKHTRKCVTCDVVITVDCSWGDPVLSGDAVIRTCKFCKREREHIHVRTEWQKLVEMENSHFSDCGCGDPGAIMIGSCEWDQGATDAQGTLYSCTMCNRTRYVPNPDHVHKVIEEWYPSTNADDTHYKSCFCGDESTIYEANCRWDEGYVMEDDNIKYTCLDCGRERIQIFYHEHEIGDWTADVASDNKHVKTCYCGDVSAMIYGDCSWTKVSESEYELVNMCSVCHRIKREFKEHEHIFGSYWYYADDKHSRECNVCSETEFFDCIYTGVPIKGPSQYNRNDVLYLTCSDCKNVKTVEVYPSGSLTGTQGDLSIRIPAGGSAYLAQGSQFVVDKLTLKPSNEEMTAIKGAVDQQATVLAQYDLALLYNGVSVQPGGKVLITVPKVEKADKYGAITVVYVDESGSVTKCNTTQNSDGSITFEAQHFSRYVIVATPKDGAPVGLIISIAVSAVIVSGAVAFAVIKIVLTKKKK